MSDLSNNPPLPDDDISIEEKSSPWTMPITMLLLIAGFLLASALMLNHTFNSKGEDGEKGFNLTALTEKGKAFASEFKKRPEAEEKAEVEVKAEIPAEKKPEGGITSIFKSREDKVRWPKLKLTGFGSSADGEGGFAIINGKQVLLGELINEKIKLVEIRTHDVVVEYQGERKTLSVDAQN